jgi:putative hydrolase of HD superfamily
MKNSFDPAQIAKFFSETNMGKIIKRSGFGLAGVTQAESLGEHIFRAAQIAYVLAFLEGANPEKAASIVLFHDNGEFRIGDQNKISARYSNKNQAELLALTEQLNQLPSPLKDQILKLFSEFENRNTPEGVVAKDAEWLETAITAKSYVEQGHRGAQNWIDNISQALETDSAKSILEYIKTQDDFTNSWWQGLKKMTFERLQK